jgi:ABC-type Fe3+-hydroxamate transport system substrate-binding protein
MRIVSLVPSATETLSAWGTVPVGCTRFCERPDLAHVGGTKDPDLDAVVALGPDLVVVDTEENRREDHDDLVARGVAVHALSVRRLADLDDQLGALARRVGAVWEPIGAPASPPVRLRAFVPIWRRPWMALGEPTYATSLLRSLGVANVVTEGPYPEVDLDDVAARRPDVVLAPSEPYPFRERHEAELGRVAPVRFVDGQDLFWWGARTRAAMGRLQAVLGLGPDGGG